MGHDQPQRSPAIDASTPNALPIAPTRSSQSPQSQQSLRIRRLAAAVAAAALLAGLTVLPNAASAQSVDEDAWVPFARNASLDLDGLELDDPPHSYYYGGGEPRPVDLWSDGETWYVVYWSYPGGTVVQAHDFGTGERLRDLDIASANHHNRNLSNTLLFPVGVWGDSTTLYVLDRWRSRGEAYSLEDGNYGDYLQGRTKSYRGFEDESPRGLWSDGETVWVAGRQESRVMAFDLATGERRSDEDFTTLSTAGNNKPVGLWSDGETMWVSDEDDRKVYAYDLATKQRLEHLEFDTLRAAGNADPRGLWSDGNTMWVMDTRDDKAYAYNMPLAAGSLEVAYSSSGTPDPPLQEGDAVPDEGEVLLSYPDLSGRVGRGVGRVTVSLLDGLVGATVTYGTADADADTDGHQWDLAAGDNTLGVTVAFESATFELEVSIHKYDLAELSDDASLSALALSGVDFGAFDSDDGEYSASVAPDVASTTVTATLSDANAAVAVEPADADADTDGHQVGLGFGDNTVRVRTQSTDGTAQRTYEVSIERRRLRLSGVEVSGVELDDERSGRVPRGVATVTVSAEASEAAATISYSTDDADPDTDGHQWNLALGDNTLDVTAAIGTHTETSTVSIRKMDVEELSDDATLSSLALSGIDFGTFDSAESSYDSTVTVDVDSTTATATATDAGSTVTIEPADVDPHTDGHQIALRTGRSTVYVHVESSDATTRTYRVTVVRQSDAPFGWYALADFDLSSSNGAPSDVWSDGDTMWVSEHSRNRIFAYDLDTGARDTSRDIASLRAHRSSSDRGIWSDGTTMWVTDEDDDRIYAYDFDTGARDTSRELTSVRSKILSSPLYTSLHGPWKALWSDGETMWMAVNRGSTDSIFAFDLATGKHKASLDLHPRLSGEGSVITGIWSDGDVMWVADWSVGKIYAYDLVTKQRLEDLEFNTLRAAGNTRLAGIWSDGTTMWATDYNDKVFSYNMPPPRVPFEVAYTASGTPNPPLQDGDDVPEEGEVLFSSPDLSGRVGRGVGRVTVSTPDDGGATISYGTADADADADGHQWDLTVGQNTLAVTITKESISRSLEISILKLDLAELSDDATLSAFALSGVSIGMFDGAVSDYSADVAAGTESVTVTATLADPGATLTFEPADADPDTDGHQVSLVDGITAIRAVVVSSDGTASRTYTVRVTRPPGAVFGWSGASDSVILAEGNGGAKGVWGDGDTLWVANVGAGRLFAYDDSTGARVEGREIASLSAAGNGRAYGVWGDCSTVWASDYADRKVYAYDLATGERDSSREFSTSPGRAPVGLWSDGVTMWVSDWERDKIYAYDLATGERREASDIDTIAAAGNTSPTGMWSDGVTMWVADNTDSKIYAYTLATGERDEDLEFDTLVGAGNAKPRGIWSDGITMWVTDQAADRIFSFNMPTVDASAGALRTLELSDVDIEFDPDTFSYAATVDNAIESTKVRSSSLLGCDTAPVSPADADADTDGHQVALEVGDNTITVLSTAGNVTSTYTVTITRSATRSQSNQLDNGEDGDEGDEGDEGEGEGEDGEGEDGEGEDGEDGDQESVREAFVRDTASEIVLDDANSQARAVWSDGTTVWVSNLSGQLYAYELDGGARDSARDLTTLRSFFNRHPNGMWSDGTTVWVSDRPTMIIYSYTLADGTYIGETLMRLHADNAHAKGLWSDGTTMWVADWDDDKLFAYELDTGPRHTSARVPASDITLHADNGRPAGIWSDGTTVWVVDDEDDRIYAYDLATGDRQTHLEFDTLVAAGNTDPKGIWSNGTTMWVTDKTDDHLYAYNMPTNAISP